MLRTRSRGVPGHLGLLRGAVKPGVRHFVRINRSSPQAHGLLRWFPFNNVIDQGNSTLFQDVVVGERAGTANFADGDVEISADLGRCIKTIDAGPSSIEFSDLELSAPFSLAAWVSPDQANCSGNTREYGHIIGKRTSAWADPYKLWWLQGRNLNPNDFDFGVSDGTAGSAVSVQSTTTFVANAIYHVCGTYDGANLRMYVNGRLEATTATTRTVGTGTFAYRMMHVDGVAGNGRWIGRTWDVRIYNVALSPGVVWQMWDPRTRWELYDVAGPGAQAAQIVASGALLRRHRRARSDEPVFDYLW